MDDLLSEFIAETRETLEAIAGEIVAWEAEPGDRSRLDAIFRFVHTVKGSCGFLDLPRLARLSHAAEDVLAAARDGTRKPDAGLVSAVLAIIDRIGDIVEAIDAGEAFPDDNEDALITALSEGAEAASVQTGVVTTATARAPARSIRLPIELLDRMMAGISDMVLARNELSRRLRGASGDPGIEAAFERLSTSVAEMRETITRTRMQRIENLFGALPRMARDTAQELGKTIDLRVEGADVELDREMIDMIRDPLTHIVRNAIDHGIEQADARAAAAKPRAGQLVVSARQSGNQIVIEVADDGRGLDPRRLVQRAVEVGILSEERAAALSDQAKLNLIFEPGFTTTSAVTAISGRGVGMDVVRSNIERIGGTVELENRRGAGLRVTLRVPLTLTIIGALTVGAGGLRFALPRAAIDEIIHDGSDMLRIDRAGDSRIATIRDRRLPLVDLEALLGLDVEQSRHGRTLVLLRPAGGESYALGVATVFDHEELVIKPASPPVMATGAYAGESLPDTGVPMLLLDPAGLAALAGIRSDQAYRAAPVAANEDDVVDTVQAILFHDLDGQLRAIRLGVVERIDDVPAEGIRVTAGRLRVPLDGGMLPLAACEIPPGRATVKILRLSDGVSEIGYAVDDIIDVVDLPVECMPSPIPGRVAGVTMVDGMPVEIIDAHWLFGEDLQAPPALAERPLCLLDGEDRWTRDILRPLVEAAGYRVAFHGEGAAADATVIVSSRAAAIVGEAAPVLRLRREPAAEGPQDDSVYRYDRVALLDRLASLAATGRR